MSLSGVRDVVGTPRERILNMSSSLRRCQAFGEKRKEGGGEKQSVMILTGSKSETFFLMRQRAVKKLVN